MGEKIALRNVDIGFPTDFFKRYAEKHGLVLTYYPRFRTLCIHNHDIRDNGSPIFKIQNMPLEQARELAEALGLTGAIRADVYSIAFKEPLRVATPPKN